VTSVDIVTLQAPEEKNAEILGFLATL